MTAIDRANALACAVAVLEGTAGGYSPEERMKHKMTLIGMLQDEEKQALKEMSNGG